MKKYIAIKHTILRNISDDEVKQHLPSGAKLIKTFEVQPCSSSQHEISDIPFDSAAILQQEFVKNELYPFLQKNPDATIIYFGAAPVALAVQLGYLLGNWNSHEVRLLHHANQNWDWPSDASPEKLPTTTKFIVDEILGGGNISFRVATSFELQVEESKDGINDIVKQLELKLQEIDKDAFQSNDQARMFADEFEEGLESIMNKFSGAETVHLLAAVPVGIAYLMGTRIRSNLNKRIALYQFNASRNPRYARVLTLSQSQVEQEPIKGKLKKAIHGIRADFSEEVNNSLTAFVKEKIDSYAKANGKLSWIQSCLPQGNYSEYHTEYWGTLPALFETVLHGSVIDEKRNETPGGFSIEEGPPVNWIIDDRFIYWLYKRFKHDTIKVQRALRLFLFHEAVHFYHHLTAYTANDAGGFPRIIEEVDYQADVWAMLHEYSYSKMYYPKELKDEKAFFKDLIHVATETMWAFDDAENAMRDEIQVRRMNRYLIWYWQALRIEETKVNKLEDIVIVLSQKPLVEINGLTMKTNGRRVQFDLLNYQPTSLEIGALINNKVYRRGSSPNIDPSKIVSAFEKRSGDFTKI
jgi:hypothetical protein